MLILCPLSHFQLVYDLKVYSPKFIIIHTIKSVGDAHCIDGSYLNTKHKLEDTNIWDENKALIENISIVFRLEEHQKQYCMVPLLLYGTFTIQQDDQANSGTRIR